MYRGTGNGLACENLLRFGALLILQLGCAGPGPRLFPPAPMEIKAAADGRVERIYDTNGDGKQDFAERLSSDGRVIALRYGLDQAEANDADIVVLDEIEPAARRHLLIILDSIPYDMVRDLREQGRFRLFHPPSRVISPFPVMTDLCLAEFFGTSPCPGVESAYYDGTRLTNGYLTYAGEKNAPWLPLIDYRMKPVAHAFAYPTPLPWFDHELRRIQDMFQRSDRRLFSAYCVGPSALGAKHGRDGHQVGLIRLDRFCQSIVQASRGRVQITLLSDHGHNLVRSRRIPLSRLLKDAGYRVVNRLARTGDVVVPEFGIVTCAAIHTREPAAVARDIVGLEGIDLAAYRSGDDRIIVLGRGGRAAIERSASGYRYEATAGDPLRLGATVEALKEQNQLDEAGFASDGAWLEATMGHEYPDALHRLWRAFHGLVENTPDVLVSVKDGWHCGSAYMSDVIDLAAAHGNLNREGSIAFVMSTAGSVPPVVRMERLRSELARLGLTTGAADADAVSPESPARSSAFHY